MFWYFRPSYFRTIIKKRNIFEALHRVVLEGCKVALHKSHKQS